MDVNISVENRHINPQKIAVTQYEAGTTTLKFNLDSQTVVQNNLKNYKAYAVTSINGYIDMVELTKTNTSSGMTLTWVLSERTLRYAGAITYKIVFKSSEKADTSVFNTYNAIIQNSVSIDADNQIVADVPSVLKQHFDLIQTLSGSFGNEVVYMPVGGSIPHEERLAGRLYYQWLNTPTTSARCATAVVNLGDKPYADSGLYINGVHVYVDDTSDVAYVIESEAWVDAINAANCGVTATDISDSGKIILKLIAKEAGSAGNDITLELGTALYGAGKNNTNPSNGRVSGTRLTGGSDVIVATETPDGQFEDAHGNLLTTTRVDVQDKLDKKVDKESTWGIPDYTKGVELSADLTTTIDSNGIVVVKFPNKNTTGRCYINEVEVAGDNWNWDGSQPSWATFVVGKGDVVRLGNRITGNFYPFKKN